MLEKLALFLLGILGLAFTVLRVRLGKAEKEVEKLEDEVQKKEQEVKVVETEKKSVESEIVIEKKLDEEIKKVNVLKPSIPKVEIPLNVDTPIKTPPLPTIKEVHTEYPTEVSVDIRDVLEAQKRRLESVRKKQE